MNKGEVKNTLKDNAGKFYTYMLCYPNDTPFYVGKGMKNRIFDHEREARNTNKNLRRLNTIRKLQRNKERIAYHIVNFYDNEDEAFNEEIEMIKFFGRKNNRTGILTNLDDGGLGSAGLKHSKEWNQAKSNETKERWKDPEYREERINCMKEWVQNNPELNAERLEKAKLMQQTDEHRELQRKITTDRYKNDPTLGKKTSESIKKYYRENEGSEAIRMRKERQKDNWNKRKKLADLCLSLVNRMSIGGVIIFPDNRSSMDTWKKLICNLISMNILLGERKIGVEL